MCELGENLGYETCNYRPGLIISDTRYNEEGQVVIIPLTKNTRRLSTHYILYKAKYEFLAYDSCVKTEQIRSISGSRLRNKIGIINDTDLKRVKNRLKTLFNI